MKKIFKDKKLGNVKEKNGIVWKTLIPLIILIIGFLVLLVVFFKLDLGRETQKDVCHYSVVSRATAISASNLLKGTLPLNCKTQYICISKDGTCEKLVSPEIKKVKTKEEIYSVLANQFSECWWMFGEGKIDYIGKELLAKNLYCSLCAQVVFDDSVKEIIESGEIDKQDFYQYLETEKVSGKDISYWNYLYEEGGHIKISADISRENTLLTLQDTCQKLCDYDKSNSDSLLFCNLPTTLESENSVIEGTCQAFFKDGKYSIAKCDKTCTSGVNSELTITSKETEGAATTTQEICKRFCNADILNPESSLFCTEPTILTISNLQIEGTCQDFLLKGRYRVEVCSKSCSTGTNSNLVLTNLNENTELISAACNSWCATDPTVFCSSRAVLRTPNFKEITGSCYALSKGNYGISGCAEAPCENNGVNEKLTINDVPHIDESTLEVDEKGALVVKKETSVNSASSSLGGINLNNQYYVVMGITSKTDIAGWGALIVGGGLTLLTKGKGAGTAFLIGGIAGEYIGQIFEGDSEQQYLRPTLVEASSEFEKLKCKDINTIS
jgi:hypothetical protein